MHDVNDDDNDDMDDDDDDDVDDDDFDDIRVEAVSEQSPSRQEECLYGLCGLLVYE